MNSFHPLSIVPAEGIIQGEKKLDENLSMNVKDDTTGEVDPELGKLESLSQSTQAFLDPSSDGNGSSSNCTTSTVVTTTVVESNVIPESCVVDCGGKLVPIPSDSKIRRKSDMACTRIREEELEVNNNTIVEGIQTTAVGAKGRCNSVRMRIKVIIVVVTVVSML